MAKSLVLEGQATYSTRILRDFASPFHEKSGLVVRHAPDSGVMAGGLRLVSRILFPATVVMLSEAKHLSESLLAGRFREPKRDPSLCSG
jgi:hypothetical protein